MKLKEHLDTLLPINRKERFYTGTVFPMIVCKDNFKYFHLFTNMLNDCTHDVIDANPENTNIQFFTEYSLKESVYGRTKERFKGTLETKDTPDIMILIDGEVKTLIAIEAKMFDFPDIDKLREQMKAQKKIIEYLENNFLEPGKYKGYHIALLPDEYLKNGKPDGINIITWQDLLDAYKDVCLNDYFYEMLRCALKDYKGLVGKGAESYGCNSKKKIAGIKVYNDYKAGERNTNIIGRDGGETGFMKDIKENTWMTRKYETNKNTVPPNINWITIEEFVRIIEEKNKN